MPAVLPSRILTMTDKEAPIWLRHCGPLFVYVQPKAILTNPEYDGRLGGRGNVASVHIEIFIHLFNRYLLSTYYVPNTELGWEDIPATGLVRHRHRSMSGTRW